MTTLTPDELGRAIVEATARAHAHQRTSTRGMIVGLHYCEDALTILARIGHCSPEELETQSDLGVRRIPWSELARRGAELPALVDEVVAEVEAAAARVEQVSRGLRLLPSPPPIAGKAVDVKLPTSVGNAGKEQAIPAVAELPLRHRITDAGLDRLREVCPGWDPHWLLLRYLEFMADKPAPNNADASLVAWGRRFTKGKAP
jgi:hypothetical protein